MLFKEWSLIVNSLMLQLAAGMFAFLALYRLILTGDMGSENVITMTSPGIVLTGPVVLAGMIASIFHLGSPIRAYRSIVNVGTSWLSREILFTGAFFAFWLACYWMERNGNLNPVLMWITVIASLLAVVSMAYIYYSTEKPGWFSFNTFTGFIGTAVIFGSVSSTIIIFNSIGSPDYIKLEYIKPDYIKSVLIISSLVSLLILIIRLIGQFKLFPTLNINKDEFSMDRLVAAAPLTSEQISLFKLLTLWGLGSSILGMALILLILFFGTIKQGCTVIIVAAILIALGELLGRSGFYSLGPDE